MTKFFQMCFHKMKSEEKLMTMMKFMRLDNNFPLKSGNKGKHWLVSCMRCLTRNSAQMVQGPSLITQKLPKNLTSDFPTISRLLCFATSNVDSCNSYPKLNSAKFLSFHVVGWVSLVMLMLILNFMLLLVLVVISILKVLTIQTFDLRSVFKTTNWNKVSGKVTRWWTVWSQSCEILKLLPVFFGGFPVLFDTHQLSLQVCI